MNTVANYLFIGHEIVMFSLVLDKLFVCLIRFPKSFSDPRRLSVTAIVVQIL